ncbi:Oxysterol-binding protein-domain-containing protein [Lasiosphaeria ovina]|uniref:Oxysterol-binding protein-domain-containing protein n=1 Tax=Lasiosphaeria ovina TaxID=92902 RepID=A0AAE0N0M7_9PEZI|nr:Oxysterol-binding protein-domain-containing protein [Lasiosphaeria ovina]
MSDPQQPQAPRHSPTMSDAGESSHRRTKSSALSLLRRKGAGDDDTMASDDGTAHSAHASSSALVSTATTATSQASISVAHQHPVRGHSSRLSTAGSVLGRTPSHQAAPSISGAKSPSNLTDKGASLESSVKKFRIVEALRNGDTASISKAIRENCENGPRASTSSFATQSGLLEDTTILHLAIQCAEQPVVEYVLSDGAGSLDINARDKDGNTPLHIAAVQGRSQVVRLLLENKEINDAVPNNLGRLPIDLARNPDIFQQLQLSRSLFAESKIRQVQDLILHGEFKVLERVLEEPRFKTVLDINSTEFASDPITIQAGGTLLHEAARRKNTKLIQVLLLHGADPFRRDRKGKLPQDVTKDEITRAMLKKSPAAVAAQRGIQEKAVLGSTSQGVTTTTPGDPLAGREAREMKGYLKKWTNYRKGYQLRWFVLEDGVLSYYKHQDDAGSACRGAINMRIAKLHMSADEKTKFEIIGKSSVKYTLKANHEVEAKRWFWALNNSIQWTKDQAKEEEKQRARSAELLKQAKAEHTQGASDPASESASLADHKRHSFQLSRLQSSNRGSTTKIPYGASTIGSNDEDDFTDAGTDANRIERNGGGAPGDVDNDYDDDDYGEDSSGQDAPAVNKDAFNITAQSAKLQLDTMAHVTSALLAEAARNPTLTLQDPKASQALSTYDAAILSLTGLIGDLLRISRDRDAYWQYRLDRESEMRRMWEESMAQVAKEQEALEARVGEAESKRKITKRILKEAIESGMIEDGQGSHTPVISVDAAHEGAADEVVGSKSPALSIARRQTVIAQVAGISDSESDEEEFFDAVDAGEVEVSQFPPSETVPSQNETQLVVSDALNISDSFSGYENGIRTKLKMDADNRPKISLWGILKSMIGKDMTKMTLPVSFNEPTSLLYRCAEDMEYADLLDLAADRTDSIERLLYVGAFAASEYASTIGRVAKPFNPLLGETFEYVRPDKNYRFFIEQVSHHPPVGAAWAESPKWTYYGESAVRSKFYGRSFDINPLGTWFLKLRPTSGGKEDFFTWKKVTSSVVGIITGNPVVDNYGMMEIKNWTTGEICYIEFKPRGWKQSSAYQIAGKIVDANGRVRVSLGGRWNSKLYARLTPGYEATIEEPATDSESVYRGSINDQSKAFLIWQANPRPTGIPFNLTPFVLSFNHIDDKLKPWLAPTDSRFRPDQRAMEEGEYDVAATEKNRLEEAQRARRRERENKGLEFVPAWFTKARCEITGEEYWKFNGKYWDRRAQAGPKGDPNVWDGLEKVF